MKEWRIDLKLPPEHSYIVSELIFPRKTVYKWIDCTMTFVLHGGFIYMCVITYISLGKLDVDPRRDDDASPMSSYRCMLRPTRMISALRHKSKFNFELKKKTFKIQFRFFLSPIFMFPCCSTLEDLSIDVLITNVGLILTKLRLFQLFSTSQNSNFELF